MGRTTIGTPVKFQVYGPKGKLLFDLKVAKVVPQSGGQTFTSEIAHIPTNMTIPIGSWMSVLDSRGNYLSDTRVQVAVSLLANDNVTFVTTAQITG